MSVYGLAILAILLFMFMERRTIRELMKNIKRRWS